jgi:hypothetical protein
MNWLKDPRFWAGVVVGYLLVVLLPQLSFRASGRAGMKAG